MTHILAKRRHNHNLEEEIEPRYVGQTGDIQHDGARVERQDVGVLHQRERLGTEGVAKRLRNLFRCPVFLPQPLHQSLECRRLFFLPMRIIHVGLKKRFPQEVSLPRRFIVQFLLLRRVVEFATNPHCRLWQPKPE